MFKIIATEQTVDEMKSSLSNLYCFFTGINENVNSPDFQISKDELEKNLCSLARVFSNPKKIKSFLKDECFSQSIEILKKIIVLKNKFRLFESRLITPGCYDRYVTFLLGMVENGDLNRKNFGLTDLERLQIKKDIHLIFDMPSSIFGDDPVRDDKAMKVLFSAVRPCFGMFDKEEPSFTIEDEGCANGIKALLSKRNVDFSSIQFYPEVGSKKKKQTTKEANEILRNLISYIFDRSQSSYDLLSGSIAKGFETHAIKSEFAQLLIELAKLPNYSDIKRLIEEHKVDERVHSNLAFNVRHYLSPLDIINILGTYTFSDRLDMANKLAAAYQAQQLYLSGNRSGFLVSEQKTSVDQTQDPSADLTSYLTPISAPGKWFSFSIRSLSFKLQKGDSGLFFLNGNSNIPADASVIIELAGVFIKCKLNKVRASQYQLQVLPGINKEYIERLFGEKRELDIHIYVKLNDLLDE